MLKYKRINWPANEILRNRIILACIVNNNIEVNCIQTRVVYICKCFDHIHRMTWKNNHSRLRKHLNKKQNCVISGVLLRKLGVLATWPVNLKLSLANFDIYSPKYWLLKTDLDLVFDIKDHNRNKTKSNLTHNWFAFHWYLTWLCSIHIDCLHFM